MNPDESLTGPVHYKLLIVKKSNSNLVIVIISNIENINNINLFG